MINLFPARAACHVAAAAALCIGRQAIKSFAIAAAACVLLASELPANAASQPAYVANGGLATANSVSSITPSLPASPNARDLLVLQIGVGDTVTFSISPSAWTSLGTQSYAGHTTAVYWAVYTPGMAAPTVSWTGQATATAVISEFAGVANSPIGAVGTISYDNWGDHTSAAVTTSNANSLVLLSDIAANFPNLTAPPNWNQALALNWAGGSQTLDYKTIASSGTSSGSTSSSGAAAAWFTQQFEVLASPAASSPTASLTANPTSITAGQSSTLTWSSTNATSCTGTGFSTGNAVSGSVSVTPATTRTYAVSCTNGSASASANAIVTVTGTAPTASLTANPASITSGQSSTLTWSSTNATSCTGTGFSTGNAVSGSVGVAPATTATYSVTCSNGSTSASANATVTVNPSAGTTLVQSVSLTAPKRNNWSGYNGMQFTTGSTGITVSQLGRWVIAGNIQSHQLELVDASTGSVLAATTLNTAGLPAGFAYAPLPSPVTLSANHSYYLVSLETVGGDYWYDNSQITTPTSLVRSIDHGIFSYSGAWYPGGLADNAYVPTDLIGALTTSTAPTASLTANPASITSGQSSTLSWSSANAATCTGTGFSTGNAISGLVVVAPTTTTTYSVACTNGSASATANATVTVPGAAPTATISANPTSITSGQPSTLTWSSTNATSCTGTGFSTGNALSGSVSVTPATTTSYFVTCTNGSASASMNATVTVTGTAPTASLTANPTSISSGQSSTLTWSSTNSISCTGSGFSTGNAISGSVSVSPTITTGYSVSCTDGSTIATANATVSLGGSSGVSMDVAPGPFNSWLNVQTKYGAVGDGVHDDTNNIQSALSAAQNNAAVVYFPAGTYKITSTLAILNTTGVGMMGHSSADTTLKWAGASGGTMFDVSGWNEGAVERLTFDGNNIAAFLHYSVSAQSSSGLFYLDNVFKNAQYGMLLGSGTTDDAERFILRNTFNNLSTAAISAQSNNALDIWPFYSTFNNNAIGVEGTYGNAFCIFCNFSANTIDIHGGGTVQGTVSWGNYSTGSRQHLLIDGCGSDNGYSVVQDDTIVNVTGSSSPIASSCGGAPMLVLHNQIGTNITPVISQNTGSGNGADILGVNNLFTKASGGMSATGTSSRVIEVGSTYSGAVTGIENVITPAPPATGTILEPSSATGSAIQALINTANTSYKGQRPVIHLGANIYNVVSAIIIPANLDVVVIGDAYGTNVNWTGPASGAVFQCNSPCKAYFMDMRITAPTGVDAVLIGTEDSAGSYVNVWYLAAQNTGSGVLVDALNNTAVNLYGLNTYTAGTNLALSVTGNNTLTAQARTAVFAGTISNSYPYTGALIGANNCPNLVMRNAWMEKDAYLGTFTCGNISFDAGQFAPSAASAGGYMMSLNGFNGKFSMLNFQFSNGGTDAQPPQIIGSTANTNVLFGMNWFRLASGPAYDSGWSTGVNTHGLMNWTGAFPTPITPDKYGTPNNSFITSMLNQMMSVEPMRDTATASGVTAAVIQNVFVQGSAAPLHVKTGI
jgi:hypothetical protein